MKLHKIISPGNDWIGWALATRSRRCLCSLAVSFEHWEVNTVPVLFYVGLGTSRKYWVVICGWFIWQVPIIKMVLRESK